MKDKILSGAFWSFLHMVITRGFQFGVQLVLVRLLSPEDFGIVGMAVVFTSVILVMSELGVASALIRSKDNDFTEVNLNTTFVASSVINIFIYLIVVFLVSPFAAWFYETPLLLKIIPVISLNVIFQTFILIPKIILTRSLDFRILNIIQIFPLLISGIISIIMAMTGWGIWSIVFNALLANVISIPLYWLNVKWRPKLQFSKGGFKGILNFGVFDSLQGTLGTITKNVDYLIVGRMVGAQAVGYYNLAFILTDTFRQQIMAISNKVMFPIYGKLQDDLPKIKEYYLNIIRINTATISCIMVVFVLFSKPIVTTFFGPEWLPSALPLMLMAIASIIHTFGGTSSAILKGLGKAKLDFKLFSYCTFFITIPSFIILTYYYGIAGMSVGVVIQKLSERLFYQYHLKRLIGLNEKEVLSAFLPTLISIVISIGCYFIVNSIFEGKDIFTLLLHVLSVVISYGLSIFSFYKEELFYIFNVKKYVLK